MSENELAVIESRLSEIPDDALTAFASIGFGIDKMTEVAKRLFHIVEDRKLYTVIQGKKHLAVEAWTVCGSLCGVAPRTVWCNRITGGNGAVLGYEARVEVVRINTQEIIGAAETECWLDEKFGRGKEKHAIKSMAQTRATSKAIAQILRWIPVLAGYSGTPAEEMDDGPQKHINPTPAENAPKATPRSERGQCNKERLGQIMDRFKAARPDADAESFRKFCQSATSHSFMTIGPDEVPVVTAGKLSEWTAKRMDQVWEKMDMEFNDA